MIRNISVLFILLASSFIQADTLDRAIHVDRIFSEGNAQTAGFYPKESLPECKWGLMYIDLNSESGKAIFSLALMAKTTGLSVVRLNYLKDSSDKCHVTGFHVQ